MEYPANLVQNVSGFEKANKDEAKEYDLDAIEPGPYAHSPSFPHKIFIRTISHSFSLSKFFMLVASHDSLPVVSERFVSRADLPPILSLGGLALQPELGRAYSPFGSCIRATPNPNCPTRHCCFRGATPGSCFSAHSGKSFNSSSKGIVPET